MSEIYDGVNKPDVVGILHGDGDWRKYETVQKCNKGFHYLFVELNTAEKARARKEKKYNCNNGWVVYEMPFIGYNFHESIKLITDDLDPENQLKIFNSDHKFAEHLSNGRNYY